MKKEEEEEEAFQDFIFLVGSCLMNPLDWLLVRFSETKIINLCITT